MAKVLLAISIYVSLVTKWQSRLNDLRIRRLHLVVLRSHLMLGEGILIFGIIVLLRSMVNNTKARMNLKTSDYDAYTESAGTVIRLWLLSSVRVKC